MLPKISRQLSFAAMILTCGVLAFEAQAQPSRQGGHRCTSGTCCSPLSGSCAPKRMTYGYVPTSWRRWPTDNPPTMPVMEESIEEVPTPSTLVKPSRETESLPAPEEPRRPAVERNDSPAGRSLDPPFGGAAPPSFNAPPQMPAGAGQGGLSPFGDEPQMPASAADPLALPFDDGPPMPPADVPNEPLQRPAAVPPSFDQPAADPQAPFGGNADPFADDPDQSAPLPESGAELDSLHREIRQQMAIRNNHLRSMRLSSEPQSQQDDYSPEPPRLLQANGESLRAETFVAPREEPVPFQTVSHPVRRTTATVMPEAPRQVVPAAEVHDGRTWRRNPLRAN